MKNNTKNIFFSIIILGFVFVAGMATGNHLTIFTLPNQYASVALSQSATTTTVNYGLPPEIPINYTNNNDGTITDNYTGLLWMKCPDGMSGVNCESGSSALREWSKARTTCEDLNLGGKTGWRLPTLKELQSIVDSGSFRPSINKNFFGASSDAYWTTTSLAEHAVISIFTVSFMDGSTYYTNTGNIAATRCVWGGDTE